MGYGAYSSFADILRQAKAQSQLRGTPLSSSAVKSIGSGYFSDALDAANTDRSYALADASQTLAEKSQAASEDQFAKNYALSNSQFAESLAQSKAEAAAQQEAAAKANTQGYLQSGVSAAGMGAMLLKGTEAGKAIVSGTGKLLDTGKNAITGVSDALTGARQIGQGTGQLVTPTSEGVETLTGGGADMARGGAGAQGVDAATTLGAESVGGAGVSGIASGVSVWPLVAKVGTGILGRTQKEAFGGNDSNTGVQLGEVVTRAPEGAIGPMTDVFWPNNDRPEAVKIATDIFNPAGALARACGIIMTAIHGADSYEVNICREYRNKFLTDEQLRGYYVFAEPVCFIMEKHPGLKKYFRRFLTEKFVDYSEYKLGKKSRKPSFISMATSMLFLKLCGYLGRKVPIYQRINGEVF